MQKRHLANFDEVLSNIPQCSKMAKNVSFKKFVLKFRFTFSFVK